MNGRGGDEFAIIALLIVVAVFIVVVVDVGVFG